MLNENTSLAVHNLSRYVYVLQSFIYLIYCPGTRRVKRKKMKILFQKSSKKHKRTPAVNISSNNVEATEDFILIRGPNDEGEDNEQENGWTLSWIMLSLVLLSGLVWSLGVVGLWRCPLAKHPWHENLLKFVEEDGISIHFADNSTARNRECQSVPDQER